MPQVRAALGHVSIPVLVNLRLGVPVGDDAAERHPGAGVSIPVLVNLRLGGTRTSPSPPPSTAGLNSCSGEPAARGPERTATLSWSRTACLNSCSGEPAARGTYYPEGCRRAAAGVSIPVLVNLRLGVIQHEGAVLGDTRLNSCSGEPAARGGGAARGELR